MKLKKWIMDRIFGGRPMKETGTLVDPISKKRMYYYIDKLGRKWMAERGRTLKRYKRKSIVTSGYRGPFVGPF